MISSTVLSPFSWSVLRRWSLVSLIGALTLTSVGCGHSEEEWQGKLDEIKALNAKLSSLQADKNKCDDDLSKAKDDIDGLKSEVATLSGKAVDLSKLTEEQRQLIERLRKEKEQLDAIRARFDQLRRKLDALTKLGLNVTIRNNQMVIQLPGDVLFDSGKVELRQKGKEMILQVCDVIAKDAGLASRHYQVAGHTDAKAYAGPYRDNWGLSLMRAREVLSYMVAPKDGRDPGGGLDPKHWAAAGYGDTDPVAANDTPENMARNRRVELVVMPNVEEMLDIRELTK
jgi:chemotaxis protein MotB